MILTSSCHFFPAVPGGEAVPVGLSRTAPPLSLKEKQSHNLRPTLPIATIVPIQPRKRVAVVINVGAISHHCVGMR